METEIGCHTRTEALAAVNPLEDNAMETDGDPIEVDEPTVIVHAFADPDPHDPDPNAHVLVVGAASLAMEHPPPRVHTDRPMPTAVTTDVVLTPETGDLIIFNSRNLHAVRPAAGGPRVTLSCFLGYRGATEPLTYWS